MENKIKKMNTVEKKGKILSGTVVSDKMQKTIVVAVTRFVKNQKYNKYLKITKRYKAHDEMNTHKVGEKVQIQECRPLSKDKNFIVLETNQTQS